MFFIMRKMFLFSVFLLGVLNVYAAPGCNKTLNLNNETLVKNLNETCSWMVQSPNVTSIVLRVSSLLLKDPRDSVLVLEGVTLLASYTNIDQSGDLLVSGGNSLLIETNFKGASSSRNVTVSLRPQAGGRRFTQTGAVSLNETGFPLNDSSPVYFQLLATRGQQAQILLNDSNLLPTTQITFYDGLQPISKNLLATQSTYSQFFPITSRSGSLLIVCQSLQNQEFFSGYFKSVPAGCDMILTPPTMNFFMQRMKDQTQCSIVQVAASKNKGVTSFRIQNLNLCPNERVTIYEGHSQYDKQIAVLTNESFPVKPLIYVRTERGFLLDVHFNDSECSNKTSKLVALSGMYSQKAACGKTLNSPTGIITSPEYPGLYPFNAYCKWQLPIPDNGSTFIYIAMETAALSPNHTLRVQDGTGRALWQFSGANLPSEDAIVYLNKSQSFVAELIFDSTAKAGQGVGTVSSGFNVTYKLLKCGGLVTLSNGSVGVPEGMPSGEACIWVISLPRSGANNSTNIIEFTLTHPKVSSNSSLTVLDGGTSKSKTFNFGSKSTQKFLSRTNALWVKMIAPTRINLSYNTYSCQKKDQCNNGLCLHPEWKCNGVDDCGDMTDEQNCSSSSSSKTGLKTYLVVIIALMCFAFGVVLTIVVPAVYKRCRYPNYRHLQDLMEPTVT
ncbi:cubilin-like isoform X1 [Crassostrea virginica]